MDMCAEEGVAALPVSNGSISELYPCHFPTSEVGVELLARHENLGEVLSPFFLFFHIPCHEYNIYAAA
jgi:hypothetical protein